jgi:hypothetical protein
MKKYLMMTLILVAVSSCSAGLKKKQPVVIEPQQQVVTNANGSGPGILVELFKGESFYYPLMAIWLEDADGNYIQTLYVAKSVATGIFKFGRQEKNKWVSAPRRAPQTLPYWAHKRNEKAADGLYVPDSQTSVPDAYSGPTPTTGFILTTKADKPLPDKFMVLLEINQNWDFNDYWTNDKYPDDPFYKMSCQPALVYGVLIDKNTLQESYRMKPLGHSHYSGLTGGLFPDLSTLTTALHITDSVVVRLK